MIHDPRGTFLGSVLAPSFATPALVSQQVTNASDSWAVRDVPASQHRLTLTRLDPGSLYEVEMAAHNCAGEGQTAMVTFRTGKGPAWPRVFCSELREGPSKRPSSLRGSVGHLQK